MIGPAELLTGLVILIGVTFVWFCNAPRKVATLQHAEQAETVQPDSNSRGLIAGASVAGLILLVMFGLAYLLAGK